MENTYGILLAEGLTPYLIAILLGVPLVALIFAFLGAPLFLWTALAAGVLWTLEAPQWAWITFGAVAAAFNLPPIRRFVASLPIMKLMDAAGLIPAISETEMQALKAGNVWVEGEFFTGKPNFKRILNEPYPELTREEQAFLDNQVEKLCGMVTDWDIWQKRDLPVEAWEFIKKEGFLGMIIPKEYGGLGFSALAHSAVLGKLASRSVPLCITVMVPNSLGPGELLNHYGTDAQKKHYLPRLAKGQEVPCFALTEPHAGSDAGSIQAAGEVFKGADGKLYVRLNWNKRWITLAAISTVLGLAFRLKDPNNLLGRGAGDLGITCALIPSNTKGVVLGKRHDPLGVPFFNCPTRGVNVEVPIDVIIGELDGVGKGWGMLMECLAAGRGVSLPAQSAAGGKAITHYISGYAKIRKQFGLSVGMFHGIAEPLARIAGTTYILEAARKYTLGAIDGGMKPPVVTAIAKYNFTEISRKMVNDAMDIQGGAAISRGPKNYLAHAYFAAPISITVEGANILTRTLIIFGQGALRGHPYAFKEVDAIHAKDLAGFDRAFWGHVGLVVRSLTRSVVLSVTRGFLFLPPRFGRGFRYYQKLGWASAVFSILTDLAMAGLGGRLKTMGKMTGRFADVLSWLYLGTAVMRRYEAEGRRKEDWPFVQWSMDYAFHQIQQAFDGIFANFEFPFASWFFRGPVRFWSMANSMGAYPSDAQDLEIARLIQLPGEQSHRARFADGCYMPKAADDRVVEIEEAFRLTWEAEAVERKVRKAVRGGKLRKVKGPKQYDEALGAGVITKDEFNVMAKAVEARDKAIQVDEFTLEEYRGMPIPASSGAASAGKHNAAASLRN
ncbi:MAG: acyl-CoA dehydrogenase [Bdellovibrionales bacterium]|nr:acyl-CoA dehydrogenase [Bdellovibrionales bacterium]